MAMATPWLRSRAWALIALDYYLRAARGSRVERWKRDLWREIDDQKPDPRVDPVPELTAETYSFAALRRLSRDFRGPVVIRGLFRGVPAVERWQSPEYFLERGEEKYLVAMRGVLADQLDLATRLDPKDFARVFPLEEIKMSEIVARMRAGEPLYINNLDTIFHRDRRLLLDLAIPQTVTEWWEGPNVPLDPVMVQMFLGIGTEDPTTTTGSGLHCARHANFFIQVVGRKRWTLVDPRYTLWVHPTPRYQQPACASTPPFDLAALPRLETTIGPGDVLYNPPWMWHQVRNYAGWTVGCATRELRFWATLRNNPMLTLLQEFTEMNHLFAKRMTTRPVARALRSLPLFVLGVALLQEALRGYVNPPMRVYGDFDDHGPEGFGFLQNLKEHT
jgi:hypothetical protein